MFKLLLVVFLVVCVIGIILYMLKSNNSRDEYDERQQLTKGKGYCYGFFTVVAANFIYLCYLEIVENPVVSPSVATLAIVCIGIVVFEIYCIKNDAFWGIRYKNSLYKCIWIWAFVAVVNLFVGVMNVLEKGLFIDGRIEFESVANLIIGITFFVMGVAIMIKLAIEKRNRE